MASNGGFTKALDFAERWEADLQHDLNEKLHRVAMYDLENQVYVDALEANAGLEPALRLEIAVLKELLKD